MPTPGQLRILHVAARQVGLIDASGDARYRLLLRNVAGVDSGRALSNAEFEDVMAVMEDMGFSNDRQRHIEHASFTGSGGSATRARSTYWRDKVAARGSNANARMVHKIRELAAGSRYQLPALCLRVSGQRTDDVEKLSPQQAWNLIEMLKASIARERAKEGVGGLFDQGTATAGVAGRRGDDRAGDPRGPAQHEVSRPV